MESPFPSMPPMPKPKFLGRVLFRGGPFDGAVDVYDSHLDQASFALMLGKEENGVGQKFWAAPVDGDQIGNQPHYYKVVACHRLVADVIVVECEYTKAEEGDDGGGQPE